MNEPLSWASLVVFPGRAPHYAVRKDKKADTEGIARAAEFTLRDRFKKPGLELDRAPYNPDGAFAEHFHLTSGQKLPAPLEPWTD